MCYILIDSQTAAAITSDTDPALGPVLPRHELHLNGWYRFRPEAAPTGRPESGHFLGWSDDGAALYVADNDPTASVFEPPETPRRAIAAHDIAAPLLV
ncbi:MAG: hypothetical protein PHV45_06915 [Desulfuromonas thiophila]|nr:hypothetical protein [Desulfuromonas thiophila]